MDPEPRDVAALLRAHLAGDEEAIETILNLVDVRALFAMTTGALCGVLDDIGVTADDLDRELRRWQTEMTIE
jgi:hypothetical protein